MNKEFYDSSGNLIEISKDDFVLCQEEKKITDKKFETKVTTFAKDAFRRFCKNKASFTAAIIILILVLLSISVPIISGKNITEVRPAETFLLPKLRKSGSGFWDGTKVYSNMVYDVDANRPANSNYSENAILKYYNISKEGDYLIDYYVEGAYGGVFIFGTDSIGTDESKIARGYTYDVITYNSTDNFKLLLKLSSENIIENKILGQYRLYIDYEIEPATKGQPAKMTRLYFNDWSDTYGQVTIDISQFLQEKSIDEATNARIGFEVLPSENKLTYIAMEEVLFTSSSTDKQLLSKLSDMSMEDANQKMGLQKDNSGQFPSGYWQITGYKGLRNVNIIYCSFLFDPYEAAYGIKEMTNLGGTDLKKYIELGYCEYDFNIGPSSFVRLSDKCPVISISNQKTLVEPTFVAYEFTAEVSMYRYFGYAKQPSFLLGTDSKGFDIVKQVFYGLRISLILSIVVSIVCLGFGLLWGAISGYFGGNVDLVMERFVDILGGIPSIVVMTLILLHLGRNIGTMAIAFCLTSWMGIAGRTRTQFYRFKGREYVLASRTLGSSDTRLIVKHILPNALGTIVTVAVMMIPGVIRSESVLAYLGIGALNTSSLGNVLSSNQEFLNSYPALIVFPAIILALIMISFNLFGNGLRDALNPSLRGSE